MAGLGDGTIENITCNVKWPTFGSNFLGIIDLV